LCYLFPENIWGEQFWITYLDTSSNEHTWLLGFKMVGSFHNLGSRKNTVFGISQTITSFLSLTMCDLDAVSFPKAKLSHLKRRENRGKF
jgi:hypothetical protein